MYDLLVKINAELRGSWRFRWFALVVAWIVSSVGWLVVLALPDSYESSATIYVDTSSALKPLLQSLMVDTDVLSRVEIVTTAMLGRPQLEKVARATDLHLRASNPAEMDRLVAGMRKRTSIGTQSRGDPNLYKISYRDIEPDMAQAVVTTLLNSFVEDSLGANRLGTQKAQVFLREELASLESELVASEQRLAEFKRENVGQMPGEGGGYFARLQIEMVALEEVRAEVRLWQRRREALQQQLSGGGQVVESNSGLQSELDLRIAENERRLDELQLRFTELHPDVIAIKGTLEQLQAQKQIALDELSGVGGVSVASDNPVFQNMQIELTKVDVEIATLSEKEATYKRKVEELHDLVDVLPDIEAELAKLIRDYDVKQAQYQSLLQSLEVAKLSESVEQSEDVQFQIIDPPYYPDAPVAPDRPLLLAAMLLLGLGLGGAVAFLANQIRPVFSDSKTLRQITGYPVLGTIQVMQIPSRMRRRNAQLVVFGVVLVALFSTFGVVFVLQGSLSDLVQALV